MNRVLAALLALIAGCSQPAPEAVSPVCPVKDETQPEPTAFPMPDGTPVRIKELVARGDRLYTEAMEHLMKSRPVPNPDGWREENKRALELFKRANDEGYFPAQEEYRDAIPVALLDRVRGTSMCASLCRKRAVMK